ncbi:DUF6268 family outer membrane beta-barrel protein [Muricauda sp. 2012CJ35-5]|uniref:DUF6268 family outer membrane beta-barrel protein n=1 Tax=Flagellimonas spongiicola TaxID=2942208 RepID=A0ABT0PN72_9FLAO|nr:DUF6268 family outer membrane beta-barrel protein [Allomuricauda spongiicola]MCL6272686.1 DUF6268 family outer membrane beta-barrel protein [Allomuricauda spongiicola]
MTLLVYLSVLFPLIGLAQSSDVFRLEYLNIPENDTGIKTQRYKFLFNVPIKLNPKKDYLVAGFEYNKLDIGYSRNFDFDQSDLNRFHVVDFNLGFITKWNENWNFVGILTPRFASNFTDGTLTDDFFMNATATFWKENSKADKPFRIVLGLSYNSTTGLPIPLPLISYYRKFHPNWSYMLGIPRSNFKYHFAKKHSLEMALFLDGYFINIQDNIVLPDSQIASKISLSALVAALGYEFSVAKRMKFYTFVGRSIEQEGKLRADNRDDVFLLNDEANFYIRTGFKIGIF